MNILSLYERYKIMPTLGLHQLRVAAVAHALADSIGGAVDTGTVVRACLLHDMGNIIKFDLSYFPEFLEPHGLPYWQSVKDEYLVRYGADEHMATKEICREIGVSDPVLACLDAIGFSRLEEVGAGTIEQRICCYADQRVGPHGVLLVSERLDEGRTRYAGREDKIIQSARFEELARALESLEQDLFSRARLAPGEITDASIAPLISELERFDV